MWDDRGCGLTAPLQGQPLSGVSQRVTQLCSLHPGPVLWTPDCTGHLTPELKSMPQKQTLRCVRVCNGPLSPSHIPGIVMGATARFCHCGPSPGKATPSSWPQDTHPSRWPQGTHQSHRRQRLPLGTAAQAACEGSFSRARGPGTAVATAPQTGAFVAALIDICPEPPGAPVSPLGKAASLAGAPGLQVNHSQQ